MNVEVKAERYGETFKRGKERREENRWKMMRCPPLVRSVTPVEINTHRHDPRRGGIAYQVSTDEARSFHPKASRYGSLL